MTTPGPVKADPQFVSNAVTSFVRIAALVLLLMACFSFVRPFVGIVAWAVILAVALYPMHAAFQERIGGREKYSAAAFAISGLAVIILPVWFIADSSVGSLKDIAEHLRDGTVHIAPPAASVADWPVVGERVHAAWSAAAENLQATLNQYEPQLKALSHKALAAAGSMMLGVLQFVLSIIIAAALLTTAGSARQVTTKIANNLVGPERGEGLVNLCVLTTRSVFKGVLGTAFIQAVLAAIGLVVMGVPAPGLLAGAVLVVAIVQLPPILVLGPVAVWVFSVADPVAATLFTVYSILVSFADTFLKPILLGRGVDVPMLVILIGAIGGAITAGIIGLFIGAVILALGYEILRTWLADEVAADPVPGSD